MHAQAGCAARTCFAGCRGADVDEWAGERKLSGLTRVSTAAEPSDYQNDAQPFAKPLPGTVVEHSRRLASRTRRKAPSSRAPRLVCEHQECEILSASCKSTASACANDTPRDRYRIHQENGDNERARSVWDASGSVEEHLIVCQPRISSKPSWCLCDLLTPHHHPHLSFAPSPSTPLETLLWARWPTLDRSLERLNKPTPLRTLSGCCCLPRTLRVLAQTRRPQAKVED